MLFDSLLVGLILISGFMGFWRGLTREIFSLLSWGMAICATIFLFPVLFSLLAPSIGETFWVYFISGSLFFTLVISGLLFLSEYGVLWVKLSRLKVFDRFLGVNFGMIRGWLLGCLGYSAILLFVATPSKLFDFEKSFFVPYVAESVYYLQGLLPSDWVPERAKQKIEVLRGQLEIKTL